MSIPHLPELLVILFIVLLIFGAGKLPDIAGSFGKSIKEFRRSVQTDETAVAEAQRPAADAKTDKA
jgi:sec-independent protein translocase protein TatA